jgi:hypothetical protein
MTIKESCEKEQRTKEQKNIKVCNPSQLASSQARSLHWQQAQGFA